MFGPKHDIPVRLCLVPDTARDKLRQFYQTYAVAEHGIPLGDEQVYHVSKKSSAEEIDRATGFVGRTVFVKALGPHDPIFTLSAE